jgi:hypothetical protein
MALEAAGQFDLVEDVAPHGYTPKLRKAIFTWFNKHLKGDSTPVEDDVTEFVEPEENLLVFGGKLPADDLTRTIDTVLVQNGAQPEVTTAAEWQTHQRGALERLRSLTFRNIPADHAPRGRNVRQDGGTRNGEFFITREFDSCDGLNLRVRIMRRTGAPQPVPMVAYAVQPAAKSTFSGGGSSCPAIAAPLTTAGVEVRNTGFTSVGPGYLWTLRRTYPLLGQTLPERQVCDLLAGIALLRRDAPTGPVALYGQGHTAVLAVYAALLDSEVSEIILANLPESHTDPDTPEFLGVLRVGDLPHNLALLWPRPITFIGTVPPAYEYTRRVYEKLGTADRFRVIDNAKAWRPL